MSRNLESDKNALRAAMKAARASLSDDERRSNSDGIRFHLSMLEVFRHAQSIHVFWPIVENGEVDLRPLIRSATVSGKVMRLPVVEGDRLLHGVYQSEELLISGQFGLLEPNKEGASASVVPDLVILPALAVDDRGHRLGYGGGFYDRYLDELHQQGHFPPLLATIFSVQVAESVPVAPFDVPVDATVTEHGIRWHNSRQDWV